MLYGSEYFKSQYGPIPYTRDNPHWLSFFSGIAEQIVSSLAPKRVLDAGCAMGFLVEALRNRGVEAHGVDVSEYAISQIRQNVAPYCQVASLVEPIAGRYDLITCIDVLQHLTGEEAREAILNMSSATDAILFSSTPSDFDEHTHANVRPIAWWLQLFAEFHFGPDISYDARFLAARAMLLRRCPARPSDHTLAAFADSMQQRIDAHTLIVRSDELQRHTRAQVTRPSTQQTAHQITQEMAHLPADLTKRYSQTCDTLIAQAFELGELRARQRELGERQTQTEIVSDRLHSGLNRIYHSRIWRTLVSLGNLLERLFGLRSRPAALPVAALSGGQETAPSSPIEQSAITVEQTDIAIDAPVISQAVFRGAILSVRGWVVAQSGIERVLIWLDGDGPYETLYGFPRRDLQTLYPEFSDSGYSGFMSCLPTVQLSPGNHSIRVQGVSKEGCTVDRMRTFSLDVKSEYEAWAELHAVTMEELARMRSESCGWNYQPKISIVTPVYRTSEEYLEQCIDSVQRQSYANWELILVDDASGEAGLTSLLERHAAADPRIKLGVLAVNAGIAGATNAGVETGTGEYVAFLDHDDELSSDALYHIVRMLNEDLSLDMLYSDRDNIDAEGKRTNGFFKPDWSPDLLTSMNYVSCLLVCRREVLDAIRGLRLGFDGSQDYDLVLRISECTNKIRHIPKVLYHCRVHSQSAAPRAEVKPAASDAGRQALNDHLLRTGVAGEAQATEVNRYRLRYEIAAQPEITIVIPTGGSETLRTALGTVLRDSTYPDYRMVVVDNSSGGNVREWVKDFQGGRHEVDHLDCRGVPFNFSLLCNRGAEKTTSPYLLFLNDDTSVISPDWMEAMLEHAQRPQVGAVGCMLLFPNGAIQHAGIVIGLGVAAHPFRGLDESRGPYYFGLSHVTRNCAAVTGACLLTRRQVFDAVGRFDEMNLPTCYQDVDLCLKMGERGYRIVYTPYARLYHNESATKIAVSQPDEIAYMHIRWRGMIENDPFYNPNLSRQSDCYDLDIAGPLL